MYICMLCNDELVLVNKVVLLSMTRFAATSISYANDDKIYVVLRPLSISVTIVFAVPFGPIPLTTNLESIIG